MFKKPHTGKQNKSNFKSAFTWIKSLLLAAGLGVSLILISVLSFPSLRIFAQERYQDLQLFARVLNLVQQYYVEEVDTKKLIYGGIKGMLGELDPHTNFLPPEVYKEFESETSGEFGGLGVEITVQNGILTVISPIEDTPAFIAGVKSGDKIVGINGESTKGLSLVEAAQKMKGKIGSKIKLTIFRDEFETPRDFEIQRAVVKIKSVKYTDLEDGFGYVKITSFIEKTFDELEKVISTHQKKYNDTKGLVLDLRRNPGGLLDQAVKISDLFLEEGTIVSTMGRDNKQKEVWMAKKKGTLPEFPLIVLIDDYSASASEIVAGALQDNRRALIMGQKSFGKGSVQSVVRLGDGSGLKLTVARYYTPNGTSIQSEGINPDVKIDDLDLKSMTGAIGKKPEARKEKDMKGHLLSEKEKKEREKSGNNAMDFWWSKNEEDSKGKLSPKDQLLKEDFQVSQAYNYLRAWKVMRGMKDPVKGSKTEPPAEKVGAPESK